MHKKWMLASPSLYMGNLILSYANFTIVTLDSPFFSAAPLTYFLLYSNLGVTLPNDTILWVKLTLKPAWKEMMPKGSSTYGPSLYFSTWNFRTVTNSGLQFPAILAARCITNGKGASPGSRSSSAKFHEIITEKLEKYILKKKKTKPNPWRWKNTSPETIERRTVRPDSRLHYRIRDRNP